MAFAIQALLSLALFYFLHQSYLLYRNIQTAKSTGLNYYISPIYQNTTRFRIIASILQKYTAYIPFNLGQFLELSGFNVWWTHKRKPFEEKGDVFLFVSPGPPVIAVADAAVAYEVTQRRNDFPKPLKMYKILDMFGRNVVTTEGKEWRVHRKITGPPFSERNNKLVWEESLHQAEECIKCWSHPTFTVNTHRGPLQVITNLAQDYMRVSLLVISAAGFGRVLSWPEPGTGQFNENNLPTGHRMSYQKALTLLIHHSMALMILPHWFLRYSWKQEHRDAVTAFEEFYAYMLEMYNEKKSMIMRNETLEDGAREDLMEALIRGSNEGEKENMRNGKSSLAADGAASLTRDEILGNTFVFILAGHETTASTMQYASILLALHPEIQKKIQRELDEFLPRGAGKDISYEDDFPLLTDGWVQALMLETLRLYQPVVAIPKSTITAQTVQYDGRPVTLPAGSSMEVNALNIHRNPKYWRSPGKPEWDPHAFRPERWFTTPEMENIPRSEARSYERIRKPVKGSFLAFSEGFRACLGKKFAIVEVVAVMARLLREYSFELPVDEAKGETWEGVAEETRNRLADCHTTITLKLVRGIDLAFVKRGEERWMHKSGEGTFVPFEAPKRK